MGLRKSGYTQHWGYFAFSVSGSSCKTCLSHYFGEIWAYCSERRKRKQASSRRRTQWQEPAKVLHYYKYQSPLSYFKSVSSSCNNIIKTQLFQREGPWDYTRIRYHWQELIIYNQTSKWQTQTSHLKNLTIDLPLSFYKTNHSSPKALNSKLSSNPKLLSIPIPMIQFYNYPNARFFLNATASGKFTSSLAALTVLHQM